MAWLAVVGLSKTLLPIVTWGADVRVFINQGVCATTVATRSGHKLICPDFCRV